MRRLASLLLFAAAVAIVTVGARGQERTNPPATTFNVVEATFQDMQLAMERGNVTSKELVQLYMDRIARYNAPINAVAYLSRTALDEADLLDRDRALGQVRGPLHGIPIAVKDIINTTNMPTTGGAVAFAGITPPYDAPLVVNLKRAGAVIIAKTTLTELANWVTVGMPANYSGLFVYSMNPYDPRPIRVTAPTTAGRSWGPAARARAPE